MSSNPKKTHPQKPKWSLVRSTAAAATTTTTTTTSTISETSASAVPDVITSHSPLPLTFPPCGSLQVQASSSSSTSSSSSSFVAAVSSLVVPTDAAIADFATRKRDNSPHLRCETMMAAQDKVNAPHIIEEDISVQDFVKRVFDKLLAPSDHPQRSAVCEKLVKDMYFTVGALRSAKRETTHWKTYAEKHFPDGFTEIATQLLYPSSYQLLGISSNISLWESILREDGRGRVEWFRCLNYVFDKLLAAAVARTTMMTTTTT